MGRRTRLKSKRPRFEEDSPGASTSMISRGDGLERRAVVNGGLHHHHLVLEGIEADEANHLGIQGLPAIRDQDDLDVVDVEHGGGPEPAGQAAGHGALVHEAAVGERPHRARHAHGRPVAVVHLAAHLERDRLADAGLHARRHRRGIPDAGHDGGAGAHPEQLAQHLGAVAGGAAARVVGHVRQHNGPALGGERAGDRLRDGQGPVDELVAMLPGGARELIREAVGEGLVAVGDDVDAEAGGRDVGEGEPREDGDGDDLRILLHLVRHVVEPPHGPARGALIAQRRQDGRRAQGGGGPDALRRHLQQPLGGLHAALGHVHVGIGLVAVQQVGPAHHLRGEVAVEVQRHRDGHRRPHRRAHGLDEVALAVVDALAHHRAVEIEQHAVERPRRVQVGEDALLDVAVDVPGDEPGGRGGRRDRGHEAHAVTFGGIDHAAQTGAGAAEGLDDLAAVVEIPRFELTAVSRDIAEGIGLVRQHGEEELHRVSVRAHAAGRASRGARCP